MAHNTRQTPGPCEVFAAHQKGCASMRPTTDHTCHTSHYVLVGFFMFEQYICHSLVNDIYFTALTVGHVGEAGGT